MIRKSRRRAAIGRSGLAGVPSIGHVITRIHLSQNEHLLLSIHRVLPFEQVSAQFPASFQGKDILEEAGVGTDIVVGPIVQGGSSLDGEKGISNSVCP